MEFILRRAMDKTVLGPMENSMKSVVAVSVGIAAYYATWWFKIIGVSHIGLQYSGSHAMLGYLPAWADLLHAILPGLLVGLLVPSRPIFLGATAAAIGVFVSQATVPVPIPSLVNALSIAVIFATASACCGAHLRGLGPNNSFKPKPLRGSA